MDPVDRQVAIAMAKEFLEKGGRPHAIFASNPEKNFSIPKDPVLFDTFRHADLLLPDGIGMVMAARMLYGAELTRVPGSDFIYDLCDLAARGNHKIFVYGAREDVNRSAVEKLKAMYPGLDIAGRSNGYVGEEDMHNLVDMINQSKAEILFVALGSPKQELWFARYKDSLRYVKVCQGIGGTLDTVAGTVQRAPEFWCRHSLEWFYRLLKEPSRIGRQKTLPTFAMQVLWAKIKKVSRERLYGT